MFTPHAHSAGASPLPLDTQAAGLMPTINQYDTSQGRATAPLGVDPRIPNAPPRSGKAQPDGSARGTEDPATDLWGNQLVYEQPLIRGPVTMRGFGESPEPAYVAAPQLERAARFFVTFFWHAPYQGGQELRENVGGHVVIRRMPNAGAAQGGLLTIPPQVNQRRVQPASYDRNAFIG